MNILLDPSVDNYGVMGNPVAHSRSPQIHAAFAEQCAQHLRYRAFLVARSGFEGALHRFQDQGGKGLNVTVPFKFDACRAVDRRTARAERAGAVNTIWFGPGGERHGDTTDGVGLVRDLRHNGIVLGGKRILVVGAGGAVSGVLGDLIEEEPEQIVLANRTTERAVHLARRFPETARSLVVRSLGDLKADRFDVVINGTSLSLDGKCPPIPEDVLSRDACCYDMVYGDADTAFVAWARRHGAATALDGLGMLVEQAAESFHIWRGVRPDTKPVIKMLRKTRRVG